MTAMPTVLIQAPAKINLSLNVLERMESGYHSLETLLCGISLHDTLEIHPHEPGLHVDVLGSIDTGPASENLVLRAARLFYHGLEEQPAIRIRLDKVIPAGAGMGGGSSDAAATLRALSALHGHPFDHGTLLAMGGALGADVPFFLAHSPYTLAWSRGERMIEIEPPPARPVLIVVPEAPIPTAAAFQLLAEWRNKAIRPLTPATLRPGSLSVWSTIQTVAGNDFEEVIGSLVDSLHGTKRRLLQNGAVIAQLTGSGSAIFGVFESLEMLIPAERELRNAGHQTHRATTLRRWPVPVFRD